MPSLGVADAWQLPFVAALELLDAGTRRQERINESAGIERREEEPVARHVGPTGVRHSPGVSKLIGMIDG